MRKPWTAKPVTKKPPGAMNKVDKPPTPEALKGNTKAGGRSANYLNARGGKKAAGVVGKNKVPM